LIDVLFLHYGDAWLRGSENCLLELSSRLDRSRFRPRVICNQPLLADALGERGVPAECVRLPEIMIDRGERRLELAGYVAITRRLLADGRVQRPDLVYCNSGRAAQAAWLAARSLGVPRLCHLHAPLYRRYYWLWGLWDAAGLVFPSQATRRVSLGRHRYRGPSWVVPNGVDLARFRPPVERDPAPRRYLGIAEHEVVVGQVASLIPRKGADVLLRALALLPAPRPLLLLAGDGPERECLGRLAGSLGLEGRVRFPGEVRSPETLLAHVIDVNVLAAHQEALPLSLLEAAAAGLPSVATDVGGASEVIEEGRTGRIVPPGDPRALAAALAEVVADRGLRARLGAAARVEAEKRFGIEGFVAGAQAAMEAVAGADRGRPAARIA